jgi:hypothetical protein
LELLVKTDAVYQRHRQEHGVGGVPA